MTHGGPGGHTGPTMAGAATTGRVWVAWPRQLPAGPPETPGAAPWGVMYRPERRWMLFATEARCRALAARLSGRVGRTVETLHQRATPAHRPRRAAPGRMVRRPWDATQGFAPREARSAASPDEASEPGLVTPTQRRVVAPPVQNSASGT